MGLRTGCPIVTTAVPASLHVSIPGESSDHGALIVAASLAAELVSQDSWCWQQAVCCASREHSIGQCLCPACRLAADHHPV